MTRAENRDAKRVRDAIEKLKNSASLEERAVLLEVVNGPREAEQQQRINKWWEKHALAWAAFNQEMDDALDEYRGALA